MALDTLSKAIGDTIDLSVGDIVAKFGGDKRAIALAAQKGEIDPTKAVMAGMAVDRVVASAAQPQNTTVAEDVLAQQPAGIGAMAPQGPQMGQPQAPQRPGQGLNQVPVPQRGFAGGGIVGMQAGGAMPNPSFAGMYTGLGTDVDALRSVLGAYPTESAEERAKRRREENAMRLMEVGLGIAGGESPYFAANLKGALPGLRGAAEDIRAQRKEDVALQMAQRAETGKLLEGVLGTRGKAAEAAAAESRSKADREAKIIAAGIANQKPTDMQRFADLTVKASKGDEEAQLMVDAIKNEYLPAIGTSGLRAQAAITSAQAGAEGKALGAYNEARALVERMLGPLGTDKALRKEYRDIKDPVKREAFVDNLVQKEMARAKAATEAFTTKGQPGAAPQGTGTKESPLPMPKSAAEAVAGKVYMTARGPARWNGKEFVPVQ